MQPGIVNTIKKAKRNAFITGTILLTASGMICKVIGFFYRIFLSQAFGAEAIGLYQLTGPVIAVCHTICAAGLQTGISKLTAENSAQNKNAGSCLLLCLITSLFLSVSLAIAVFRYAEPISILLLKERRCVSLLRIFALSFPFSAVHACINGYLIGANKTKIPAICQILEQLIRVASVFISYNYCMNKGLTVQIALAAFGTFIGEVFSSVLTFLLLILHKHSDKPKRKRPENKQEILHRTKLQAVKLYSIAIPISLTRLATNLLQSIEAIHIPQKLIAFGYEKTTALSVYGILTGMSLPMILFPSALINAFCIHLLPAIAKTNTETDKRHLKNMIRRSASFCFITGIFCTSAFLILGKWAGQTLFHNELAGNFILILSFLCPLLYTTAAMNSVLNGLGKTTLTFLFHSICLIVRLFFIIYLIPLMGIYGYLIGLLCSELLHTVFVCLAVANLLHSLANPT